MGCTSKSEVMMIVTNSFSLVKEFCKAFVEVPGSRRTSPLLVALIIQLHSDERGEIQKRDEGKTMREEERSGTMRRSLCTRGISHEREGNLHSQQQQSKRGLKYLPFENIESKSNSTSICDLVWIIVCNT